MDREIRLEAISPAVQAWQPAEMARLNELMQPLGYRPLGFYKEKEPVEMSRPTGLNRDLQNDLGHAFGLIAAGHQTIKAALGSGNIQSFDLGVNQLAIGLEEYYAVVQKAKPQPIAPPVKPPLERFDEIRKGIVGKIEGHTYKPAPPVAPPARLFSPQKPLLGPWERDPSQR